MAKKQKDAVPGQHWERQYRICDSSANMKATKGADFDPKHPEERKTTHLKVNVTDY